MSSEAIDLLEEFRAAAAEGNQRETVVIGNEAADALIQMSDREAGIDAAARIVATATNVDETSLDAARTVVQRVQSARNRRAEFGVLLQGLSAGNFDSDEILAVTDSVIEAIQAADEAIDRFRATPAAARMKPLFVGIAPSDVIVPKGDASPDSNPGNGNRNGNRNSSDENTPTDEDSGSTIQTVEVMLENVGGNPATKITATLDSELPSATIEPLGVDHLTTEEVQAFTLSFDSDTSSGRYHTQISFGSEEGAADAVSFPIFIVDKVRYVDEIIDRLESLREAFEQIDVETQRPLRPLITRVAKVRSEMQDLKEQVSSETIAERKANQRLFTVARNLSGLDRQISSLRELSEVRQATLTDEVDSIVETLETAREADT